MLFRSRHVAVERPARSVLGRVGHGIPVRARLYADDSTLAGDGGCVVGGPREHDEACIRLVVREGRVQPFSVLQQRLNRKKVTATLIADFPMRIRAYDLLAENGEDLRPLHFEERRARLEDFCARCAGAPIDLSPLVPFATWDELAAARKNPAGANGGPDAEAIEGVMLKRRDSAYVPGRPKGPWWKWKRDPMSIDAVLMYAQRGHGKRSSFYSDYTFGLWRPGANGEELVPVGKAYFGFTDEELYQIDRFVRNNTIEQIGRAHV